ncbi:protein kinase [Picosynechococcus sp. PCC 7003]|uniref:serine/threonine-protein kinase n=1 Tax=Picosynechococcus sp. PCC 7003 TaxID=374981 RepID=UPI00081054B2|nr:serine/threonine-protein kinase [Picosynechococcus sp. PCC 7003]ANV83658.1 protein kinase [Picosynechococcus sp. PCC 7003]
MTSDNLHQKGDFIANRYEIVSYVDQGGMQEVYLAFDRVIKREVALKVPFNSSATKRFARSARMSAKVNHPNVAKTLDYFETDKHQYLIEEFIQGKNLKDGLLQRTNFVDPYLTAKILHYLAKGIAVAHEAGVVHRDLKPSNVMSTDDFNLTEIKITDFGIAKMAEEEMAEATAEGESSLSTSKTAIGALPYMSPEMIEDSHAAGKESDIWSLGAMVYEIVSGEKPFGFGLKAVKKILDAELPSKPTYLENKIQFKFLGDELFNVILSCLQKNPKDRPTANELVKVCETFCYPVISRKIGEFIEHPKPTYGFIRDDNGQKTFFHFDSVYGRSPQLGDKVSFSAFPGSPYPRAHPVIVINK